jgi:nitroimidazol reductase NimA-like FMN-containing flavoprotein (pyridoxamine 5'-phosphate oxidase superfamily)/GNAT superfamily N-acetyltransferase
VTAISQERIPLVYQKSENWIFSLDRPRSTFRSMRKEIYRMDRSGAEALLARAPVVRVAGVSSSGAPVLRTVHGVVVDGALAFHGAPAGEKMEAVGREAVASADETVASIPSYFVDPERACPATTYYLSAQVHGVIERVDDPAAKARVLSALMAKFQPEGGHVPIDPSHPLYTKAVAGILVLRIPLERLDGKAKLAQNRSPAELGRILQKLWERGLPSDPRAIDLVRAANPGHDEPSFLRAAAPPAGARLACALDRDAITAAVDLLDGAYWNEGFSRDEIARALKSSPAWVGAHDDRGALIATGRAYGDGVKRAWIADVMIAPAWRGRGLGAALMRLLLGHPVVRGARKVSLFTRDADLFYAKLGFVPRADPAPDAPRSVEMTLSRS